MESVTPARRTAPPVPAGAADHATLRLSFTTHPPEEIAEGLRRLGAAVAEG